ncbi:MAG TPA: hypothetical protein VKT77_09955 [Chthonomonadaceae bacterium]|nr:hypothetical protein [Chthonomonadaceae bacterium]
MDYGSRDVYHIVLGVAAIPVLAFVIWLSWVITNKLMSPDWQRKKRAREIRKAMAEREALMAELHAEERRPVPEQDK